MNTILILALSFAVILTLKIIADKVERFSLDIFIKALSVMLCLLGILRYFLSDSFVETVGPFEDPIQSFLRWGYYIGYAIIPMSVFFDTRLFRNIASYFSLPVSILAAILYKDTFAYFTAGGAGGYYINTHLRHLLYSLELIIAIVVPVLMQLYHKHVINLKTPKEALMMLGLLPLIMLQMMPSYIPSTLMGNLGLKANMFGNLHLIWICCLVIETILLYFIFRKRSEKDKFAFITFMVIAQVMHTMSPFLRGFTYSRLPLQLCNIAAFFYLYTIITKNKKLFDFCYIANLVGAAIAIALFTFTDDVGALTFWPMHYVYEHSFVVMMPILGRSLGLFPRLDKSSFKNMMKIFAIYFAFVFIFGTIINGIDTTPGFYPVNHFYMFNTKVAVDYIPFAGFTGLIHWKIGEFEIYPILVVTVFVVFSALNLAFLGINLLSYKIIDKIKGKKATKRDMATV